MFSQTKICFYFITREQFERFKLWKRLSNIMSVKELRYYCTQQGLWLEEVDIKETMSRHQIQFMNQGERLSGDVHWSTRLENSTEASKDSNQGLFTKKACVFGTQEAVASISQLILLYESFSKYPGWIISYYRLTETPRKLNLARNPHPTSPHNFFSYFYTYGIIKENSTRICIGAFLNQLFPMSIGVNAGPVEYLSVPSTIFFRGLFIIHN